MTGSESTPKVNSTADAEYWTLARRPLQCLMFLLPLLVAYEVGVVWTAGGEPASVRNGADAWMRAALSDLGIRFDFLLPILIVLALGSWHLLARFPWRVSLDAAVGMSAESLLFAFLLIACGQAQQAIFQHWNAPAHTESMNEHDGPKSNINPANAPGSVHNLGGESAAKAVTYVGAGIYEEFLFRLCLLPMCYGVFRWMGCRPRAAAGVSVILTSLMFAGAHHIGPHGESWVTFVFFFRFLAGVFFAMLFVLRGFGITVGCHAAYDLLVGILLAPPA